MTAVEAADAHPDVVAAVVKRYRGVLRAVRLEAADAAQSGWVAFCRAAAAWDGRGTLGGYLYECVRREVLLAVRAAAAGGFTGTGLASGRAALAGRPRPASLSVRSPDGGSTLAAEVPARRASGRVYWGWDQWEAVLAHLTERQAAVIARKYRDGSGTARGWDMGDLTAYESKRRQAEAFESLLTCPALAEYRPAGWAVCGTAAEAAGAVGAVGAG